jgi:hypothetical protein
MHLKVLQPTSKPALDLGNLLRINAVSIDPFNDEELARAQIPRPSFYLVRPDGYIGLCGVRLEAGAVARYVSERLGLRVRGVTAPLSSYAIACAPIAAAKLKSPRQPGERDPSRQIRRAASRLQGKQKGFGFWGLESRIKPLP